MRSREVIIVAGSFFAVAIAIIFAFIFYIMFGCNSLIESNKLLVENVKYLKHKISAIESNSVVFGSVYQDSKNKKTIMLRIDNKYIELNCNSYTTTNDKRQVIEVFTLK